MLWRHRHVLNCFSYTGAFSVSALAGGALSTTSVDISPDAIEKLKHNIRLNGFPVGIVPSRDLKVKYEELIVLVTDKQGFIVEDVFEYLRRPAKEFERYSLAILDPPAFAKRSKDIIKACRGYKDINRFDI